VLDKIAGVQTDRMDRPYDDVIIESVTIEKA
jgi:peptidyl-prolyl cis-trans isomerase B (cyclophilin B)